jgi:hypothetical protein
MANRNHYPVDASKSDVKIVFASAVGAAAADLTGKDDDLLTATRTGVGVHTLTFRHKYPKKCGLIIEVVGTTVGLEGQFTAWDPAAGTATLQLTDAGVAADAATTDTILITMFVRNTRAND